MPPTPQLLFERFDSLGRILGLHHAFTLRVPGIDVAHDKNEALRRLGKVHRQVRQELGIAEWPLLSAEQIHADKIAIVDNPVAADYEYAGCDGLLTNQKRVVLEIRVADCCAVYIVDPKTPAIALVHSGKKGTELEIVGKAIQQMRDRFDSDPANLIVQLSACIRPPHYEIDFAAKIVEQAKSLGVKQIYDCDTCTACDLGRYYSYRAEKGKTGRMLALLGLK